MIDSVPRPVGSANKPMKYGTVRLPDDVLAELREIARRKDRSANYVALRVMRRGLEVLRAEGWTDAED
jgi:predicted transcriptional regulator